MLTGVKLRRWWLVSMLGATLALAGSLAGCASFPDSDDAQAVAEYKAANDPLEPLNRYFFELNRGLDMLLLRWVAEIYRDAVPDVGRSMVKNFLDNLRSPVIFGNDLLQGEFQRAGETGGRFIINSTAGILGLFDVASYERAGGLEFHNEDFGQTLGAWGVNEGPYLVLPLLGPSPVRDTFGLVGDYFMDPVYYYARNVDRPLIPAVRFTLRAIDSRSRNIETLDEIERSAIDLYATIRSLYRQRRNDEIRNGQPAPTVPMPEISIDMDDEIGDERASAKPE
ncbi:MAG TPA: VacJ family lipoprotein [Alphaproteobacteria bacterium]|jgi:phospholipid-binding lipoprotein MlaA|nr:VacJ family lipoprotein [Alphaproteobacteria bacterium]MDP7164819.1 VacJ family lipoprotein [Alphaproteobacteria bacterium]HJM52225.1 VacJ family lipoprotein [Alphaproteobacteria bacterium]